MICFENKETIKCMSRMATSLSNDNTAGNKDTEATGPFGYKMSELYSLANLPPVPGRI